MVTCSFSQYSLKALEIASLHLSTHVMIVGDHDEDNGDDDNGNDDKVM